MKIALIGNPNSGKTTFFNAVTGKHEKTGNWAGVTIVKAAGKYKKDRDTDIIDLPGVYSFSPESRDEKVVSDFIEKGDFDAIINVVDCVNLERNLYLTLHLINKGFPCVVALNFFDDAEKNGIEINEEKLSRELGVPVIKTSAKKRFNVDKAVNVASRKVVPLLKFDFTSPNDCYSAISKIVDKCVIKNKTGLKNDFTRRADDFITGKYTGIPFFISVIFLVYFLSLKIGGVFSGYIERFFSYADKNAALFLSEKGVSEIFRSLFSTVLIKGLGNVAGFFPQILVLFILLSLMEESGYMARVSFIMDRVLRKIGLGGNSVIPFVLSCGCTVAGISASRTISDDLERENTIYLCSFMPCGAKTAVFGWFSYKFFGGSPFIAAIMYFIGVLAAVIVGFFLNERGKQNGRFALEIPPLRKPTLSTTFRVAIEKTKDFLIKSGTVVFAVSLSFWFLIKFGVSGYVNNRVEESFLYYLGNAIKIIFRPLGFNDWKASVALLSGIFAKESVIETAELLSIDFVVVLGGGYKVFAYMTFILLSPPCSAALSVAKRELVGKKSFIKMLLIGVFSAYGFSTVINFLGVVLTRKNLLFSLCSAIIVLLIGVLLFVFNRRRENCKGCNKCKKKAKRFTT